jgi:hypothetical protein
MNIIDTKYDNAINPQYGFFISINYVNILLLLFMGNWWRSIKMQGQCHVVRKHL